MAKATKLTKARAIRVAEWAQGFLRLQGWKVRFLYGNASPPWGDVPADRTGETELDVLYKTANIWVRSGPDALRTIMHEVLELAFADAGYKHGDRDAKHALIYALESAMVAAYLRKAKP